MATPSPCGTGKPFGTHPSTPHPAQPPRSGQAAERQGQPQPKGFASELGQRRPQGAGLAWARWAHGFDVNVAARSHPKPVSARGPPGMPLPQAWREPPAPASTCPDGERKEPCLPCAPLLSSPARTPLLALLSLTIIGCGLLPRPPAPAPARSALAPALWYLVCSPAAGNS